MKKLAFCLCLVSLVGGMCVAAEQSIDGGSIGIGWEDTTVLVLRITFDEPTQALGVPTWVVTDLAHRSRDGIFAWQVHYSSAQASVLVIPNDFLMTRSFTFAQLGIEVLTHEPGQALTLRISRDGLIPNLALPSDLLEIHALWKQMEPVATLTVPAFAEALEVAGAGGEAESPSASPVVSCEDPLPDQSVYLVGEPIRHSFVVVDPRTGEPDVWAAAHCEIVRHDEQRQTIVEQSAVPKNVDTGVFELSIDTSDFAPAFYDLCIWLSADGVAHRKRIEIRAP